MRLCTSAYLSSVFGSGPGVFALIRREVVAFAGEWLGSSSRSAQGRCPKMTQRYRAQVYVPGRIRATRSAFERRSFTGCLCRVSWPSEAHRVRSQGAGTQWAPTGSIVAGPGTMTPGTSGQRIATTTGPATATTTSVFVPPARAVRQPDAVYGCRLRAKGATIVPKPVSL